MLIEIRDPCPESWDKMKPVGATNRHCSSCDKIVVDFTCMSLNEVRLYLQAHAMETTCGRLLPSQLKPTFNAKTTVYQQYAQKIASKTNWMLNILALLGLSSLLLTSCGPDPTLGEIADIHSICDSTNGDTIHSDK